jgi:hypothetical protein
MTETLAYLLTVLIVAFVALICISLGMRYNEEIDAFLRWWVALVRKGKRRHRA